MALVAVAPHKYLKGFDDKETQPPRAWQVMTVREALARRYDTDAHLVTYVSESARAAGPGAVQCRINKGGLASFPEPVTCDVLFADIDNPGHAPWSEDARATAIEGYRALPILATAGVYYTAHGARIVQPLSEPVPVEVVEAYLRAWTDALAEAGLAVDLACRDWTRVFRLPHVRRRGDRGVAMSPFVSLAAMRPVEPASILPVRPAPVSTPTERATADIEAQPTPAVDWSAAVPGAWTSHVPEIAEAVREVGSEWHTLFLALSGALLSRGVPPEDVPAVIEAISQATRADSKTADRVRGARTTVVARASGRRATGYSTLKARWPAVAEAVARVTARGAEARVRGLAAEPPIDVDFEGTPQEAIERILDWLRRVPDGVSMLIAECGLGKTRAAILIALERARKAYASEDAQGVRAPPQSKTVIVGPTTAFAEQTTANVRAEGEQACRHFGPLSLRHDDGTPVCHFYEPGRHLANGGVSVRETLCEGRGGVRCRHYASCPARIGLDGPKQARIHVGTHAQLGALLAAGGPTGLTVIDEMLPPLRIERTTLAELTLTRAHLAAFEDDFAGAIEPALVALGAWLGHAGGDEALSLADAITAGAPLVPPELVARARAIFQDDAADLVDCARYAPLAVERLGIPDREADDDEPRAEPAAELMPLAHHAIAQLRYDHVYAELIGRVCRVVSRLLLALRSRWPARATAVAPPSGACELALAYIDPLFETLADHEGAVVVMDANADRYRPLYEHIFGYAREPLRVGAADGAPIERTMQLRRGCNRRGWFARGKLTDSDHLIRTIRIAFDWALEDPNARTLAIIGNRPVELALQAGRERLQDRFLAPRTIAAWSEAGQDTDVLDALADALARELSRFPGAVVLGHYGSLRGLDHMRDADALVTLGDPWVNLGQTDLERDYLRAVAGHDQETLAEDLCRAELEQAHGRLRTIHRDKPGRALHIGSVLPGGPKWREGHYELRHAVRGREAKPPTMSPDELRAAIDALGGIKPTARAIGFDPALVRRWLGGRRPVSREAAFRLRELLPHRGVRRSLNICREDQ